MSTKPTQSNEKQIAALEQTVAPRITAVGNHPLFARLATIEDIRCLLEHHVYAVWDFMCLLKALQQVVTCTRVPWVPVGDASVRRLINEICLDEESDELPDGRCFSHLEMYRLAMAEAGADDGPVELFLTQMRQGTALNEALKIANAPMPAAEFVRRTFDAIDSSKAHCVAAYFSVGREEAIPAMFTSIVENVARTQPSLATLRLYLDRHIELDGGKHGPLAMRMLAQLCGDDARKWQEATDSALAALDARMALWDGVLAALPVSA